jgi:hypothetical protein
MVGWMRRRLARPRFAESVAFGPIVDYQQRRGYSVLPTDQTAFAMSSPFQPSLPLSAAASVKIAKTESARGNLSKAFEILAALVSAGTADSEAFDAYRRLHTLVHGREVPHAQVFDFIYAHDEWEGGSGPGSFPGSTAQYRAFLQDFMRKNKIRSVVDVGCGELAVIAPDRLERRRLPRN